MIPNLVIIFDYFDFVETFRRIIIILTKIKNFYQNQDCLEKVYEKILILVKVFERISMLVKIFAKS